MAKSCKGLVFVPVLSSSFILLFFFIFFIYYYYFSLPVADGMLLYYIFCLVQGNKEAYKNESGKQKENSFLLFLFLTGE